jgi:Mor family transcriptional regulator
MEKNELTEHEKNLIIDECINTKKTYKSIAKKYNLSIEEFYEIINEYCRKHQYTKIMRGIGAFEKEDGTVVRKNKDEEIVIKVNSKAVERRREIILEENERKVQELEKWYEIHGRLPRIEINRG